MRKVEPEVFLIAKPQLSWPGIAQYLRDVDGAAWFEKRVIDDFERPPAQDLVEFAGRLCYRSWEPGLNPNVTRVREQQDEYLQNIIKVGHGSVLEHANFTFVLHNVSRVFTHEIVRHRMGVAISQESLRFVRLTDIPIWMTDTLFQDENGEEIIVGGKTLREEAEDLVHRMEVFQKKAAEAHGLDKPGVDFHTKKTVTSAMRRFAPEGVATGMVWSANVRALRHIIEMRTDPGAEEEIRIVGDKIATIMAREVPALFADYTRDETGNWDTEHRKV